MFAHSRLTQFKVDEDYSQIKILDIRTLSLKYLSAVF